MPLPWYWLTAPWQYFLNDLSLFYLCKIVFDWTLNQFILQFILICHYFLFIYFPVYFFPKILLWSINVCLNATSWRHQERALDSAEIVIWVTMCGFWKLNPVLVQGHYVFLTIVVFSSTYFYFSHKWSITYFYPFFCHFFYK